MYAMKTLYSILYPNITKSSAVAVIADRTSYEVRYTIKPVSVTSLRTAGTHDPIQRVELMNASKLSTQA